MAAQIMNNNQMVVTDALWHTYLPLLDNGTMNDLSILPVHQVIIGKHGINYLCARLANYIHAPTTVNIDAHGVCRIHAKNDPRGRHCVSDKDTKVSKPLAGNKGKIAKLPRPANSFILYRQHHHPHLKAEHPEMHSNEISSILGKQWKNESEAVKDEFKALAEKLKQQHFLDHPNYQYRPRKPSEKKRRMTRRKAMALAAPPPHSAEAVATGINPAVAEATKATPGQLLPGSVTDQSSATAGALSSFSTLPEMAVMPEGNALFSMGADDFETQDLQLMLEDYNATMPKTMTSTNQVMVPAGTPVLYNELSQDAQDDFNFFSEVVDFDVEEDLFKEDGLAKTMMGDMDSEENWVARAPYDDTASFDFSNAALQDNELFRTYTNLL